jgi:hypothetical protein
VPLSEEASVLEVLALMARVRRAAALAPWHLGWFKRIYCTYRYLQRLARVHGGRHGAVVATSMPQLVRGLGPALGWERSEDRFADRDRHHASLRRWLEALEAAGMIRWRAGENEEGELCRTEVTLLPVPELDAEELAAAEARWHAWRRRYGASLETGAQRCLGDIFARVLAPAPARRRDLGRCRGDAIHAAREGSSTVLAPPFGALPDGRENPLRSAHTCDEGPALAGGTGARGSATASGAGDDAGPGATAPPGSGRRKTPSTERARSYSNGSPQADAGPDRERRADSRPSARQAAEKAPSAPVLDGLAIENSVAARLVASAWRRTYVARQARERARALLSAPPGERHGLASLREAWIVYRFGTEIRPDFTTPESGAERVGDHGHVDAGPRTAGQLERAAAAIAAYERYTEYRPAGWPLSGAGALCALAAQCRAETLDGDIARLACLARDMRATARHRDPRRLERLRRRARRRAAALRQALPFNYRRPAGPSIETVEQRRERVRGELLLGGHDPGGWPNAALAIDSSYSPATAGPTLIGWEMHEELDGTATRARRYADEQRERRWDLPPRSWRRYGRDSRGSGATRGPHERAGDPDNSRRAATADKPRPPVRPRDESQRRDVGGALGGRSVRGSDAP